MSHELDNCLQQPDHPILDRNPGLRATATRSGLDCLDHEWKGVNAMYRFRCHRGHVFPRTLQTFSRVANVKCPICRAEERMNQLRTMAEWSGVKCLEAHWLGSNVPHRFQCAQGHVWSRVGRRALSAIDCPQCGWAAGYHRRRAESLAQLHQIAVQRGGVCLNTTYQANKLYRFRCGRGHEWEAHGNDVKRRTWCPECARLRKVERYRHQDGLERLRQKAAARGGRCLAEAYFGLGTPYKFRCAKGHEWEALGHRILRGGWCLKCANDKKRLSIEDARESAETRGGQCLSTTYIKNTEKLHWLCHRGHGWHASYAAIRAGHWCPECAHMARITNPKSKAWKRYKAIPLATETFPQPAIDHDTPP